MGRVQGPVGAIHGTVLGGNAAPIPNAAVAIFGGSPRHRDIAALTNTGGEFDFPSLTPGRYTLVVNAVDRDRAVLDVEVEAGDVATPTVVLA